MKKFVPYILVLFCVFSVSVLGACNQNNARISFDTDYIEMNIGDELDVYSKLEVEGVNAKEVTLKSLDSSVISLTDGQATAVGQGTTIVQALYENKRAILEIKVNGEAIVCDAPLGLMYDKQNGFITWNHVLVKIGNDIQQVNSYTVEIKSNDTTKEEIVIGDNKYQLQESGVYEIRVKCNSFVSNQTIVYQGSDYSESIVLTKLDKPYNLSYNDETKTLSWEASEDIATFVVNINGVLSEPTQENEMVVDLTTSNISKQETFEVSVISQTSKISGNDIVASSESDKKVWTRLYAPALSIDDGVITWDNSQKGNFHYEIIRTDVNNVVSKEVVSGGSYSLTGITAGTYNTIQIQAVSDSEEYLSSENVSVLTDVIKLEKATLSFNPLTKTLSVSNYDGKKIELEITYKNSVEKIELVNGSYVFDKTDIGAYTVNAYVYAQNNKEINADVSNTITLLQLSRIDTSSISQSVVDNKYFITFNEVENADTYSLSYIKDNLEKTLVKQGDGSYGDVNNIFSSSGAYQVVITASSSTSTSSDTFILPSKTIISVVRQEDVVAILTEEDGPKSISWDAIPTANGYKYYITKNNEMFQENTTSSTLISIDNFEFGKYSFFVKAVGAISGGVLYLDSLNYAQVDFEIELLLDTPTMSFDVETKILTITKVNYANNYEITINSQPLVFDNSQETITIDLTQKLTQSGDYVVSVKALNADNELIFDSNVNSITITKLSAPQQFNLSTDGVLTILDYPNGQMLDENRATLLINDENTETLDNSTTYTVKAKFNATKQKIDNHYYLDSEISQFNIERLTAPASPTLDETLISWQETTQENFTYLLTISQGEIVKQIQVSENQIDVFDEKFSGIDTKQDFAIKVCYLYVGANINLQDGKNIYFTSQNSEQTLVHKIESDAILSVVEQDGKVIANWTASLISGVNYELMLNDEQVYSGEQTSQDITSYVNDAGKYTLKLKVSKQGYLTSEFVEVYVERLQSVESVKIDEDENIIVETNYTTNDLPDGTLAQLEKISITKDDIQDLTNLSSYFGKFEIQVGLVAKTYTEGKYYFLSSDVSTFKFNRIQTLTNPTIMDNTITWDNIAQVTNYKLKFSNGEQNLYYTVSGENSISTQNQNIKQIINSLNSKNITVSVSAQIGEVIALKNVETLLSSYFSTTSQIIVLSEVENITFESTQQNQQEIKISWQYSFEDLSVKQFVVDIYKNGEYLTTLYSSGTNNYVLSNDMLEKGEYYAVVKVQGTNNCIDSNGRGSVPYTRLATVSNINITQDALLTFTGVTGALKYGISYYANDMVKGEIESLSTSVNLKEYLFASAFSGQITINIYSIGGNGRDDNKTFSSKMSENFVVTKPVEAEITLSTNKLVAGQTEIEGVDNISTYLITISTDNRVVKEIELSYGEEYLFEDWYYQDTNEKVPTNVEKTYSIKVQRQIDEQNYIKSDTLSTSVIKLAEINNVGFIRKQDSVDSTIYVRGNVVSNASKYVLNILDTDCETKDFNVSGQFIELALIDDIYKQIPKNFTMSLYAQGLIGGSINYIDSAKVSISGTKLNSVTNFKTVDGALSWDKVDGAYDYAIDVNSTEILTGYVDGTSHKRTETLNGRHGEFVLNIKAVGNVNTTLVKNDVVLDSLYILNNDGTRKDYSCKKLEKPTNFKVVEGYIAFTKVDGALGYQVVYGTNYYELAQEYSEQTEYAIFYSQEMYNMFKENQKYAISVRATSTEENVIYSDSTGELYVKILSNNTTGTLNIVLKQTSTNPVKYDYTISQLVWSADINATNGYNVNYNGEMFSTNNTEFVLDGDGNLQAGQYQIKVAVAGTSTSDSDGSYLLNSKYSETLYFSKLNSPNPKVLNGELTWDKIEGATGYLLYLGDELQNSGLPITSNSYYVDLSNSSNTTYSSYKVRAVSTSSQYIASSVGTYKGENDEILQVVKLHSPDSFMIKEGAFRWELNDIWSLLPLVTSGAVESPFTATLSTMISTKISMKFTSKTSMAEFSYEDYAIKYCFVTDELKSDIQDNILIPSDQKEMILALLETYQYNGWPTLNNGYLDMGADLPAGAYNLTLRQKGDSTKYLTSNYGNNIEVYVPYAPQISIVYSNNSYVLSWNAINIPTTYNMQTPTYVIFADKNVEEDGKTVSKRVEIGRTKSTSYNITNLVENGTIDSSYTAVYVFVAGDNDKVLNGKISNKINVTILNPTTARVRDGVVYWNAQESASGYQVTYTEKNGNVVGETKTLTLKDATWDCAELQSYDKIDEYTLNIQAIGLKVSTTTHAIISGPNSNVGNVSKLPTPLSIVEDGLIKWTSDENSSSYKVLVNKDNNLFNTISIINQPDLNNYIWYESTFTEQNLLYKFQAIGSNDVDLSTQQKAFVSSNKGSDIYGTTITKVSNVVAKKGVLYWDTAKNNNINISYYKLTFNQIDDEGNPVNEDLIIINNNFTNADGTCSYDCLGLASGKYRVTIQAFFKSSDNLGTYDYNGETAYYLMSVKSDSYEFQKYSDVQGEDESGVVYNIVLKDGEFTWKYVGSLEEDNYQYELKFKINEEVTKEFIVITEENSYYSNVTDKLINENPFELQIRVIPKDGVEGFINSNYVTFVNPNNENLPNIYQLNGIGEDDIVLRDLRAEDIENMEDEPSSDLHIIWNKYNVSTGNQNVDLQVKYKVDFWTSEDATVKSIIVDTMYINTLLFQSTISDEYTLYYTIQVLPLGNQSYIPSCECDVREIQKPQSVESVGYNSEEKYFYWSTEGTSNDHTFKIKDEIIEINESGEVVYVNGEPNVLRTYIYTTKDNLTNRYTPIEQGMHKVSVAIVVRNSENEGSLTSDYTYYYDQVLEPENKDIGSTVLIDLFKVTQEGSNGTQEKPYLIETKEQFNNIKYRLQKDEYLNSYTLIENDLEQTVTLSQENMQFNFKQLVSIYNVTPLGQGTNFEFLGNYDGNKKTLSWDYDLSNISAYQSIQYVALFSQIASGAKVQNLRILANLTGQLKVGATISLLSYKNLGTVQNVVLGSQGLNIDITSNKDIFLYGIAYQNLGTIQNTVNYYNVSLKNNTDVLGIKASFASIAGENEGMVIKCANYGNITLQTTISTSGGIVGTNRANGTVEACVLKNQTTTLSINKQSQQGSTQGAVTFYFGGIVGQNDGTVNYCYTYTNSVIYRSAPVGSVNKVYIAGLVGLSNNGNIKGSYVYNIVNASSAQGIQIGNVYLFAYITWASGGVDTRCFYNEGQSQSAIGGVSTDSFNITSYPRVPLGDRLNGTESNYYLSNENEFPIFEWENEVASWVE